MTQGIQANRLTWLYAILMVALIGLQLAASWHSADHVHEGDDQHVCTLCLAKSSVASSSPSPELVAALVLLCFVRRQQAIVTIPQAPASGMGCRGPPVVI
ncbi:hypothetical protein K0504_16100 [Neiella marina]|uniref:DUF2607 family protein n=1 Tax=Neiella holothuriorum TaxID=2870530 RepID=A0ABS7EL05_9GAMM|nr:hypothetical protein [Neiella holothuriorum]MBW8192563.1 hypothetical protein [Neiella holothuriorum]